MKSLAPLLAVALLAGGASAQSLWRDDGRFANYIVNNTARRVGDTLTILISEKANISNSDQTKLDQAGSFNAQITNFDIAPNAFSTLPAFAASHQRSFDGRGDQTRDNRFETRVQVQVLDVLPNGTLIVVGRRTIRVDDETKTLEIRGIVRPEDVTATNTVRSEQVANAAVSYVGDGALTRTTTKGAIAEMFDFVFHLIWPF